MAYAFAEAKHRLWLKINSDGQSNSELIVADPWIISSLLQKSIRRGEAETAKRAALSLFLRKGSAIWRRLIVIAFEDIGAGCPGMLSATVAAATDATWRKTAGGDAAVAIHLAYALANAPKDRSADYLICGAKDHPSLEQERYETAATPVLERLRIVADLGIGLSQRAMAAWYASGIEWSGEERVGQGNLPGLLDTFRALGAPEDLVTATGIAAQRTREPIVIMVPLVWIAANEGPPPTAVPCVLPPTAVVDDVPMYALDKHTRLGREAIWRFVQEDNAVRDCLERYVPKAIRREAAYMAAFYTDAMPVSPRLHWAHSDALEAFGTGTDMLVAGVPPEGHAPVLDAFRGNLGHLNEVRADVFVRARRMLADGGPPTERRA